MLRHCARRMRSYAPPGMEQHFLAGGHQKSFNNRKEEGREEEGIRINTPPPPPAHRVANWHSSTSLIHQKN